MKPTSASDLQVRRRPVHRAVAVVVQPVAVTGAHGSVLGLRGRRAAAAYGEGEPVISEQHEQHAGHAGDPAAEPASSTPEVP